MTAAEPTKPEPGPAASRSPTVPAPAATPRWYGTDALGNYEQIHRIQKRLNRIFNRLSRGTTLNNDGDEHDQRRKLDAHRLLPGPCGR
jgi:hypothetical protein